MLQSATSTRTTCRHLVALLLARRCTIADAPLAPDITGENHRGKGYYNRCWPVTHVNDRPHRTSPTVEPRERLHTRLDSFTKWAEAFPLRTKEAEPIARILT